VVRARLELARAQGPTDFKSALSTIPTPDHDDLLIDTT
jgi:hypothetical protein